MSGCHINCFILLNKVGLDNVVLFLGGRARQLSILNVRDSIC